MKQFIVTLLAVLLGGFLALIAYDRLIVKPREAQRVRAEQVDLGKARRDAREVAAEVEQSVQRSVDSAQQAMDRQAGIMDERTAVTDAVQRATMFRVALTEYYQTNGRWPQDAEEAGLPPAEDARGGAVRAVRVGRQGVVTVALDDRFGVGSEIVLRPAINPAGMVDWTCTLQGNDALKRAMPRCKG